jgi:hypothetical protein
VRAVLCIRETRDGYRYRALLASTEEERSEEQWFDAVHLWNASRCLYETHLLWWGVRLDLEEAKGVVRRFLKKLLFG